MSVFVPYLRNYAPFYIQREVDELAIDIRQEYGVTVKVHEYPLKRKAKQPYRNEWLDRDGDDEFVDRIRYEAVTMNLSCVIMAEAGDSGTAREELKALALAFREIVRRGSFLVYDAWTGFGFQRVRLEEFQEIREGSFSVKDGHCRLIFGVVFKINDPVADVVLENGKLKVLGYHSGLLGTEDDAQVITETGQKRIKV